jgi:hypothetical protein
VCTCVKISRSERRIIVIERVEIKSDKYREQFGNRAAQREFGILESNVRYWRTQKELLNNAKRASRAVRGPKAGKYSALEGQLLIYFEELTNDAIAVTPDMLQLRAGELAKSHNISHNEFKASRGWLQRFGKRNVPSLHTITTLCQKLPRDFTEKVFNVHRYEIRMREEHSYLVSQIGNAGQNPVFIDTPRNTSIEKQSVP